MNLFGFCVIQKQHQHARIEISTNFRFQKLRCRLHSAEVFSRYFIIWICLWHKRVFGNNIKFSCRSLNNRETVAVYRNTVIKFLQFPGSFIIILFLGNIKSTLNEFIISWTILSRLLLDLRKLALLQTESFADVLQNSCSYKFHKFHRKTPVLESLFNKIARLY